MLRFAIATCLAFCSCKPIGHAVAEVKGMPLEIDAGLRASVDRFLSLAPSKGKLADLDSIKWGPTPAETAGICDARSFDTLTGTRKLWRVTIKPTEINNVLDALVAHELGHCLFGMKHTENKTDIMGRVTLDDDDFWKTWYDRKVKAMFETVSIEEY